MAGRTATSQQQQFTRDYATTRKELESKISDLHDANNRDENLEIEVRYGNQGEKGFDSKIDRSKYVQILFYISNLKTKDDLGKSVSPFRSVTKTHSVDKIYKEIPGKFVEEIIDNGPNKRYHMNKQSILNIDNLVENYSMRISISRERKDDREPPNSHGRTVPTLTREKKRKSFELKDLRFDFTEVTVQRPGQHPFTIYEFEIEIVGQDKLKAVSDFLKQAFDCFKELIGTSSVSLPKKFVVSNADKRYILTKTNSFCDSKMDREKQQERIDYSIISNARTVKARDLTAGNLIPRDPANTNSIIYTMTIKADGTLKLLVIDETGIYFIGPPDNIIKIRQETIQSEIGSVFIGELVENTLTEGPLFLFFDALSIRGDTRVQQKNFNERYAYIDQFLKQSQIAELFLAEASSSAKPPAKPNRSSVEFRLKEFFLIYTAKDFYTYANQLLNTVWPFSTDGLILTPFNFPYHTTLDLTNVSSRRLSTDPDILKVKSAEDLTIDFEVRHEIADDGSQIQLYCSNGNRPAVRFKGDQQNPFSAAKNLEISPAVTSIETFSLGEFYFDSKKNKLVLNRPRPEKPKANSIGNAIDIWKDMHQPIEEKTIRGQQFALSFRYHSRVKGELYEKMCSILPKDARYLLTVGAGRGGDINHWRNNGITHVVCVEPDEKNREELVNRLSKTSIKYLILPYKGEEWQKIAEETAKFIPGGKVHMVTYMLSLTFFFYSGDAIASVYYLTNATLMNGGLFSFLSFDGIEVEKFFRDPANAKRDPITGISTANFKQIQMILYPSSGGYTRLGINIPNSIVNQDEYLTNIPGLIGLFQQGGFNLVLQGRTDQESFLTDEEIQFTKMFSYAILQKK